MGMGDIDWVFDASREGTPPKGDGSAIDRALALSPDFWLFKEK